MAKALPENFDTQMKYIGMIAMFWNMLEADLYDAFNSVVGLDWPMRYEVVTRVGGHDGVVGIIKASFDKTHRMPKERMALVTDAFGRIKFAKQLRDNVVHCRPRNMQAGVGMTVKRQGQTISVPISVSALEAVMKRLMVALNDAGDLERLAKHYADTPYDQRRSYLYGLLDGPAGQETGPFEEAAQAYDAQFRERQTLWQSLPPPPTLPTEEQSLLASLLLGETESKPSTESSADPTAGG